MTQSSIQDRARAIADAGGVREALDSGRASADMRLTLSEAVIIGPRCSGMCARCLSPSVTDRPHSLKPFVTTLMSTSSTSSPRATRPRAAHAATALRWVAGIKSAVVTSIGPGALHAFAGSLTSASNGVGVWHIYGDETTEDEGPNFQQLPGLAPGGFQRLCQTMGRTYNASHAGGGEHGSPGGGCHGR